MTTDPPVEAITVEGIPRRPRDRKLQIARNASELFAARGFHAVRMDDIAENTGITARALYRHYHSKQALLLHVVLDDQQVLLDALARFPGSVRDDLELSEALQRLVSAAIASGRLSLLWQREARHLGGQDHAHIRARARLIADKFECIFVREMLTGAPALTLQIRSWAGLSLLTSSAHNCELTLTRGELERILVDSSRRMIQAISAEPGQVPRTSSPPATSTSRREQLIAGAANLFRSYGYAGVGIDDIGATAGVAGPAMYRYFQSKAEILVTTVTRYYEWSALEETRALRVGGGDPIEVLNCLLDGYIRLALEAPDLLAVAVNELLYLPQDCADRISRLQAASVAEWIYWLRAARADVPEHIAQATVRAARIVINNLALIPHLHAHPNLHGELRSAAEAVLFSADL